MEALFKKYFWVIKTLGIAAAVGLGASAVTTQIGTAFALDVGGADDPSGDAGDDADEDEDDKGLDFGKASFARNRPSYSSTSLANAKKKVADEIERRNIFCPSCVPETATAAGAVPGVAGPGGIPGVTGPSLGIQPGEVRSSLPLKLMATMEAEDPELSLATVFDADSSVTGLYALGEEIRPGVEVVGVDLGLVHLRNNAQLEYLELGELKEPPKTAARPTTKDRDTSKRKKNPQEIDGAADSINCPNENTCIVERKFVEQLMANPALLARQARIVPSQRDGETQGFKFYGIRRGSLPKLLGLKNGDMLTEVNGEEIKSVDQAMGLAMKLRRASNLSVTLVRKGKTITKEIQIQ